MVPSSGAIKTNEKVFLLQIWVGSSIRMLEGGGGMVNTRVHVNLMCSRSLGM